MPDVEVPAQQWAVFDGFADQGHSPAWFGIGPVKMKFGHRDCVDHALCFGLHIGRNNVDHFTDHDFAFRHTAPTVGCSWLPSIGCPARRSRATNRRQLRQRADREYHHCSEGGHVRGLAKADGLAAFLGDFCRQGAVESVSDVITSTF